MSQTAVLEAAPPQRPNHRELHRGTVADKLRDDGLLLAHAQRRTVFIDLNTGERGELDGNYVGATRWLPGGDIILGHSEHRTAALDYSLVRITPAALPDGAPLPREQPAGSSAQTGDDAPRTIDR